jgi:hypothetical protein
MSRKLRTTMKRRFSIDCENIVTWKLCDFMKSQWRNDVTFSASSPFDSTSSYFFIHSSSFMKKLLQKNNSFFFAPRGVDVNQSLNEEHTFLSSLHRRVVVETKQRKQLFITINISSTGQKVAMPFHDGRRLSNVICSIPMMSILH